MAMNKIIIGLGWYIVFLFSLTLHESAHALMAKLGGDATAYHGGQVTLNPLPHVRREPVGTVLIPLISFVLWGWMMGWASAPYNSLWAYHNPKREGLMSIAGPLANLSLVACAAILIRVGIALGWFLAPQQANITSLVDPAAGGVLAGAALLLSIMFSVNLVLFLFNLIPFPPLDGSGALLLFLDRDLVNRYRATVARPAFMFIGMLVIWRVFGTIFSPVFTLALNILYPGMGYH
jgi:Zn-dependent protease